MERYPHIFSPGRIGKLTVKNRIKYAATETNFNTGDGFVTDREVAYMEAQARGGAGIVTTQGAYPDMKGEGKGFKGMMSIADDRFIPGLSRIADVIKQNNALSCLQILHCGREGGVNLDYCLMPSVVSQKLSYFKEPREITYQEIKESVKDHVRAAKRAIDAGFDIIELSGIVGYLISTFISRYTNKRNDEYGGDIRQRCRLMVEILQGIKAEIGDAVPVGIRLCGLELLDDRGGNTVEESLESFKIAEEAGADYVSVTVGWHESSQSVITRDVPMGHWLYVARMVKETVNVPVMMAFRQFVPDIPEKALTEGKIDFWEACRPMIADPELPLKIKDGREDEIIPCIACNVCFSRLYYHQPIMCSVRPTLGHEGEKRWGYYGFETVENKRKILVIGGGPAGLQFASIAAKKGHSVVLYEKSDRLGGSLTLASKVDEGAVELLRPARYLERMCRINNVDIKTGVDFEPDSFKGENADLLVIAIGSVARKYPDALSEKILTPYDVMIKREQAGRRIVIIGGDGVGLGVAVFLLNNGDYDITIVEESGKLGRDVSPFYLWQYIRLFKKRKVVLLMKSKVEKIKYDKVYISSNNEHNEHVAFDNIVIAQREPAIYDYEALKDLANQIFFIGDAKRPRRLLNAIHDGYRLGMEI